MAHWTETQTTAHSDLKKALKVVDDILSFVKEGKGKPSKQERALFAAAIAFAYGVWESYVEQLAIELVRQVAPKLDPANVPDRIKKTLEKCSAWELTVSPGWRELWIRRVEEKAVGDDGDKYGLNTAKAGQVQDLLEMAGVRSALETIPKTNVPLHLKDGVATVAEAVNRLVELRGGIVHTGAVPTTLAKAHVREWREFVENVANGLDSECRKQCKQLS